MKMKMLLRSHVLLLCTLVLISAATAKAENIVYPADAGVIDVVRDFGANGSCAESDTACINANTQALRNAFAAAKQDPSPPGAANTPPGKTLYFPNGRYLINDKLGFSDGEAHNVVLQGQSKAATIIKLKNFTAGYTDVNAPRPLISFFDGASINDAGMNGVRNMTIDVGRGNDGAIALLFMCNNGGGIRDVTIKSSDANRKGFVGLDLTRPRGGQGYINRLTVVGFNYGIRAGFTPSNYILEDITLRDQITAGLYNGVRTTVNAQGAIITDAFGKSLSIRKLSSYNTVPAIVNAEGRGHIVIIDSNLTRNTCDSGEICSDVAIDNQQGFLFARNVRQTGYDATIKDGGAVQTGDYSDDEYVSGEVEKLFRPQSSKSLSLPIRDVPEVPWDDPSTWVKVDGSQDDDTAAIQAALDQCTVASGKTTVYFPRGIYYVSDTIRIGKNVRRIIGMKSVIRLTDTTDIKTQTNPPKSVFVFEGGTQDVVVISDLHGRLRAGDYPFTWLEHASTKTLVLDEVGFGLGQYYKNTGTGDLFMINTTGNTTAVQGGHSGPDPVFVFTNQRVWARGLNPEDSENTVINDGSTLWVLGFKWEGGAQGGSLETKNAGKTEVLGGVLNSVYNPENPALPIGPAFIVNDGTQVSVTCSENSTSEIKSYDILVRQTKDGETRELLSTDVPRLGISYGSVIPLFVGGYLSPLRDISAQLTITRSGFVYVRSTNRFTQTVTITNNGSGTAGPISLVLDDLSCNASLYNKTGIATFGTPTAQGSPYININVGGNGLQPGETRSVVLEFTNPTRQPITYGLRVLAGSGRR